MDGQGQTTAAMPYLHEHGDPVERDRGPIDRELADAYSEIATLSELVTELDRRTKAVQTSEHGGYATPDRAADDPEVLSPVARAVREQHDQVAQINDHLRTILSALQT